VAANGSTQRTPFLVFLPFQRKGRAFPRGLPQAFLVGFEEDRPCQWGRAKKRGEENRGKVEEKSRKGQNARPDWRGIKGIKIIFSYVREALAFLCPPSSCCRAITTTALTSPGVALST